MTLDGGGGRDPPLGVGTFPKTNCRSELNCRVVFFCSVSVFICQLWWLVSVLILEVHRTEHPNNWRKVFFWERITEEKWKPGFWWTCSVVPGPCENFTVRPILPLGPRPIPPFIRTFLFGKKLFYLLQLLRKFSFSPATTKPGTSPPSTFQTVAFYLPRVVLKAVSLQ